MNNVEPQILFPNEPNEQKISQDDLLNNIKLKFQNLGLSVEIITNEDFNDKLLSFPKSENLLREYNLKFYELLQINLPTNQESASTDLKDQDLIELQNPIKISGNEENYDLFKGFINKNNSFTGKGCYITNNYIYSGFFQNDEFNGKGIMINKDGSYLFGDWFNGVCTGKGILKMGNEYEYEGDFLENKKHGYGIEKYKDGSKYEGEFKNDKKNGKGKLLMSNGEIYEGEFKDDLYDGEGVYKWTSESREYKGQFKNGNINGKGINIFKDGSVYEGYYKNGLKHGSGKYTWPNGKVFYGNWLNNKLHGNGYYILDNEKYNITFRFGKIISTSKAETKGIKFTIENIVDKDKIENIDKYICSICNTIYINPQKCCKCFKNYCSDCIKDENGNKKCLNCGEDTYEMDLDLLHELIIKIKVYCNICQKTMGYEESLSHNHT